MKTYPSIFNDCLSPVSPGPSSSNTAGPYRLGSMAVDLLEGKPSHLYIEMAKDILQLFMVCIVIKPFWPVS